MISTHILAQCVMCYRSAAAAGAARGRVFDIGIIVLLIPPLAIIAALLWRASHARAAAHSSPEPLPNADLRHRQPLAPSHSPR